MRILEGQLRWNRATEFIGRTIIGIEDEITVTMAGLVAAAHRYGAQGVTDYLVYLESVHWMSDVDEFRDKLGDQLQAIERRLRLFQRVPHRR